MSSVRIQIDQNQYEIDLQPFDDLPKVRDKVMLLHNIHLTSYNVYYTTSAGVLSPIPETVPMSTLGITSKSVLTAKKKEVESTGNQSTKTNTNTPYYQQHRNSVPNLNTVQATAAQFFANHDQQFQQQQQPRSPLPSASHQSHHYSSITQSPPSIDRAHSLSFSLPTTVNESNPFGQLEQSLAASTPIANTAEGPVHRPPLHLHINSSGGNSQFDHGSRPSPVRAISSPQHSASAVSMMKRHSVPNTLQPPMPGSQGGMNSFGPNSPGPKSPHPHRSQPISDPVSPHPTAAQTNSHHQHSPSIPRLQRTVSSPTGSSVPNLNPFAAIEAQQIHRSASPGRSPRPNHPSVSPSIAASRPSPLTLTPSTQQRHLHPTTATSPYPQQQLQLAATASATPTSSNSGGSNTPTGPNTRHGSISGSAPSIHSLLQSASSSPPRNNPFAAFDANHRDPHHQHHPSFDQLQRPASTQLPPTSPQPQPPPRLASYHSTPQPMHTHNIFQQFDSQQPPSLPHELTTERTPTPTLTIATSHQRQSSNAAPAASTPNPFALVEAATSATNQRRPSASTKVDPPLTTSTQLQALPDLELKNNLAPHLTLLLEAVNQESCDLARDQSDQMTLKSYALEALLKRMKQIQTDRLQKEEEHSIALAEYEVKLKEAQKSVKDEEEKSASMQQLTTVTQKLKSLQAQSLSQQSDHAATLAGYAARIKLAEELLHEEEKKSIALQLECDQTRSSHEQRLAALESASSNHALTRLQQKQQLDDWISNDFKKLMGQLSLAREEHSDGGSEERRKILERACQMIEEREDIYPDFFQLLKDRSEAKLKIAKK